MNNDVFWRRDGTAIPVEYSANPLMEEGSVSGMVVAFQDVSERRRLDRMKDEFISTVSHELRTPLTSLRAALGLVSSGALDKRPEKQRQMVEMAIGNCDRLVRLVNDILDFDSVEKGRLSLQRQSVEAVDLLRRAADVAHSTAGTARIDFLINAAPAMVLADEERIMQVLNELVTNAIKFSKQDTTIRLSARRAVAKGSGANEVCFIVEDQGRGIAQEKLERIFERFQQGDASDSRTLGGTGLGLALCRSIVEQHGGRIWAESEVGKGSASARSAKVPCYGKFDGWFRDRKIVAGVFACRGFVLWGEFHSRAGADCWGGAGYASGSGLGAAGFGDAHASAAAG